LIKSVNKDFYNVTKDFFLNKCCSFQLSILKKSPQKYAVFNIDNNKQYS